MTDQNQSQNSQNQDWFAQNGIVDGSGGAPAAGTQTPSTQSAPAPAPTQAAPADDWFAQNGISDAHAAPPPPATAAAAPTPKPQYKDKPTMQVFAPGMGLVDTGLHFDPTSKQDWHDALAGEGTFGGAMEAKAKRQEAAAQEMIHGHPVAGFLKELNESIIPTGQSVTGALKSVGGAVTDNIAKMVGTGEAYSKGLGSIAIQRKFKKR
jgi:hypothetical protein